MAETPIDLVKGSYKRVRQPLGSAPVCFREIYFKEHRRQDRTVFFAGIPHGSRREATAFLERIALPFGEIEKVDVDADDPTRKRGGRVTFVHASSLKRLLAADSMEIFPTAQPPQGNLEAAQELIKQHVSSIPRTENLQRVADKAVLKFEKKELAEARKREDMREGVPDEDGFVTVVSKKKKRDHVSIGASLKPRQQSKKKKRKTLELTDFYRHQIRENKKEQLLELRRKFEEDKLRVAKMKEQRKFRPY